MTKSKALAALLETVRFARGLISEDGRRDKLADPQGSYAGQLEEAARRLDAGFALFERAGPDDEYQGWANRETWTANLWIGNDERLYVHARSIAHGAGSIFEKQDKLEKYMRRAIDRHDGFIGDMLNASFARIDWRAIVDCLAEA